MAAGIAMEVRAPLSGVIVPLDAVPDPVFARKMVGDGVSIDPTSSEVLAPFAGVVTQLHAAHHALAITADNGVEVLVHVGLDTVTLGGKGFTPLVRRGERVACGQPLLRFDPDAVACGARSLLTEIVVASGDKVARLVPKRGVATAGETVLLELVLSDTAEPEASTPAGEVILSEPIRLPNAAGLHARPAAVLAAEAKRYAAQVFIVRGEEEANARSVVAVLGLSTKQGDALRVKAVGADARRAVAELSAVLAEGCGERAEDVPSSATAAAPAEPRRTPSGPGELTGAPASPGVAIGRVLQHRHVAIHVEERGGAPDEERAKLVAALREAARQIEALQRHSADRAKAGILGVQLALLEDPDLVGVAERRVQEGKSAGFACQEAFGSYAAKLDGLDSALLRERAADVRDVGRRVLALLAGAAPSRVEVPEGTILVADELSPSDTAAFDRSRLLGFCTTSGGSTSHVAILARSLGIPAVCGIDESALSIASGTRVVIDGTHGVLRISPDEAFATAVEQRIAREAARADLDASAAFATARTKDGHRLEVVANVTSAKEAREAVAAGAEGVGLLRTEFLFGDRDAPPSEAEQEAEYRAVAEALGKDRRLVVRTLDVGGDKPLAYLPLPKEANPFLGLRGIRVSLDRPDLFRAQLRAILRAAPAGDTHVMFPMIATLDELRAAKDILAEEQRAIPHAVKVGAMIEVPSAAVIAEVLAREVDFFSIGTNDLTQYTMAMDRGHPKLAKHADALHPAVLRMIAMTVEGAHEHGKWVGVCGGLASDPLAVPLLAGLGVDELSVSVPAIAAVKATLSRFTLGECATIATDVLRLRTTADVRAFLRSNVEAAESSAAERAIP